MLEFQILNGRRKGSTFVLHSSEHSQNQTPYLLEDESVVIKFRSDIDYKKVVLYLHENEVEYTHCEFDSETNEWVYSWIPKRLGVSFFESFFHNFFGIAELCLSLSVDDEDDYFYLEKLDVLAKKINAERVDNMLLFLAKHDNDALCSFFRVTRRNSGYKDGDTPADIFLEWIEQNTKILLKLIDDIASEPITKLISTYRLITPTLSSNIDDRTLGWLCDNLDELYETEDDASAIINYNGNYYGSTKIRENVLLDDTDVYENQVIHGFVHTLKISVSGLLAGYDTEIEKKDNRVFNDGYVSFYNQIKKFQRNINNRKIIKCNEILHLLNAIQNKIKKVIPVKRKVVGIPSLTMKVKYNRAYLAVFNKIIGWYRFGSPDWSKQDELLSIKSMPKLFEYYCLFYLKEQLDNILNVQSSLDNDCNALNFNYHVEGVDVFLKYEPKYWMPKNKNSNQSDLVNTEAWSFYNDSMHLRGHYNEYSHRSPDFVISIERGGYMFNYILDAKYTTQKKAFSQYLPELTMKYIHGLHSRSGESNLLGLTLIAPNEKPQVNHFHGDDFNILSPNPVVPALNVALIRPGGEFAENIAFEKVIDKILILLFESVDIKSEHAKFLKLA